MHLKLTDGHVISPYIIWGELDYRGFVSIGFQTENKFCDLDPLRDLSGRKQLVKTGEETFLYVSYPLAAFTPTESIFNLRDDKLLSFYRDTYEGAQDELMRVFYRIKHFCPGYTFEALHEYKLFENWHDFFDPQNNITFEHFNPGGSILDNCLPEQNIEDSHCGFRLNGCLRHFISVSIDSKAAVIADALAGYPMTINLTERGSSIIINLFDTDENSLAEKSLKVKELIHSIPGADYYEANELSENMKYFEESIPGWIFTHPVKSLEEVTNETI